MASIAIVDDDSEVVALLYKFLTHGRHRFLKMIGTTHYVVDSLVSFKPELIVVPLFRQRASLGRPIGDYYEDIHGARMLALISGCEDLADVPILVFAIATTPDEIPPEVQSQLRWAEFLMFPEGLQLINPTISGFVGTAEGTPQDRKRLKENLESTGVEVTEPVLKATEA